MAKITVGFAIVVAAMLLITAPLTLIWAWCLMTQWRWFIVPQFHVAELSMPVAVGMSTIVTLFRTQEFIKDEYKMDGNIQILTSVAAPALAMLIGYIAHLFMH